MIVVVVLVIVGVSVGVVGVVVNVEVVVAEDGRGREIAMVGCAGLGRGVTGQVSVELGSFVTSTDSVVEMSPTSSSSCFG